MMSRSRKEQHKHDVTPGNYPVRTFSDVAPRVGAAGGLLVLCGTTISLFVEILCDYDDARRLMNCLGSFVTALGTWFFWSSTLVIGSLEMVIGGTLLAVSMLVNWIVTLVVLCLGDQYFDQLQNYDGVHVVQVFALGFISVAVVILIFKSFKMSRRPFLHHKNYLAVKIGPAVHDKCGMGALEGVSGCGSGPLVRSSW